MRKSLALICLAACLAPQGGFAAESVNRDALQRELTILLRQHPEIVLDVLKEHSETILDIAQQGSNQRRLRSLQAQWKGDMQQPKKVNLNGRPVLGPKDAPVTIVAFSDFTCPYCEQGAHILRQIVQTYGNKVRIVFKHMPLDEQSLGVLASKYFIAASLQNADKAWQLYDKMFMNRDKLITDGEAFIRKSAEEVGLQMAKLRRDLKNKVVEQTLTEDLSDAKQLNIEGTPYFLVNNLVVRGALQYNLFKGAVDMALQGK